MRPEKTHCRVTLKYDRADETEMVIRILFFGPVIKVIKPSHFVDRLRERIERARQFARNDPGIDREAVIN